MSQKETAFEGDYMDLPAGRQVKKLIYASIHVIPF
jgi:hypothetical protein